MLQPERPPFIPSGIPSIGIYIKKFENTDITMFPDDFFNKND